MKMPSKPQIKISSHALISTRSHSYRQPLMRSSYKRVFPESPRRWSFSRSWKSPLMYSSRRIRVLYSHADGSLTKHKDHPSYASTDQRENIDSSLTRRPAGLHIPPSHSHRLFSFCSSCFPDKQGTSLRVSSL